MRTLLFLTTLSLSLALSACRSIPGYTSIDRENSNPLVASRYGEELADSMANYIIANDPITKNPGIISILEQEIERGKDLADAARAKQSEGALGGILQMKQEAFGLVLLLSGTLYLSSDFMTTPGPSLHAFLTEVIDPRDVEFPDSSAIDLGEIQSAFGAQQYNLPKKSSPDAMRTFVLFDTALNEIYAFAQLR